MTLKKTIFFSPSRTILFSMSLAICIGTFLLSLPIASTKTFPFIDYFFTAVSSACVTGLMTIPIENFTMFGLTVIMCLIQIGGLGIITLTLFALSLFTNLGLGTQVMAGEMLDLHSWKGTRNILLFITGLTFTIEAIGALLIFQTFKINSFFLMQFFIQYFTQYHHFATQD